MRVVLLLSTVALAFIAAGCGGAGKSSSPPGDPQNTGAAEGVEPATQPGDPADGSESPTPTSDEATEPNQPEEPNDVAEESGQLNVPTGGWATDFSTHSVPLNEFFGGGPGKDGIPAIDSPEFVSIEAANEWLEAREPVVEVEIDGVARAYPLQILIWHEIANDEIAGTPVTVTFCPLCNTALAFDRRLDDLLLDFGTTGNLRNSDLVMYDRQTESWWQQFGGEAVVGELTGKTLTPIPAAIVSWEDFASAHPEAEVLSRETGHSRPYGTNPYVGYDDVDQPPFFPVERTEGDGRLPPKERVVFIEREGESVVVPLSVLEQQGTIGVTVAGEQLEVSFVEGTRSALDSADIAEGRGVGSADVVSLATGERVTFDLPFWFAVAAFRPDAVIVTGADQAG